MSLSQRSAKVTVASAATQRLLTVDGSCDAWRLVDLGSATGLPFDVTVNWTSARAADSTALLTISRNGRVCIHARSISLDVVNLANTDNTIYVAIADCQGPVETHNTYEVKGPIGNGMIQIIPPYALAARLEVADPAVAGNSYIEILDGTSTLRSWTYASAMPSPGVPLGGARVLRVTALSAWRLVYTLAL